MMINVEAFMIMELMEMDSLLRIPPPDTFRRLGFGGFSWLGVSLVSLCVSWRPSLFSPQFLVNIVTSLFCNKVVCGVVLMSLHA